MSETELSVLQVAAHCKVGQRRVNYWFDSGRLTGRRVGPPTFERFISLESFRQFLAEYGFDPYPESESND